MFYILIGVIIIILVGVGYLSYLAYNSPSLIGAGYDQKMQKLMHAQTQQSVTAFKAIQLIRNLPEVKQWQTLFTGPSGTNPTTGGKPVIAIDSESSTTYSIHVYEDMPDHTATFGWYKVDKTSSVVTNSTPGY